jgi:hypothetical protein
VTARASAPSNDMSDGQLMSFLEAHPGVNKGSTDA